MSMSDHQLHELKCWPAEFAAVWQGVKTFEVRRDDRGFAVGDVLHLREYDPGTAGYSGRSVKANVTYILDREVWPLGDDIVVMAIVVYWHGTTRAGTEGA